MPGGRPSYSEHDEAKTKRSIPRSTHMRPSVETEVCMHAHIGFLARGHIAGEYSDGCTFEYVAPQVVTIDPGHDAWVVGDEAAVLIQFDSEEGTARRFGLPEEHGH